MKTQLITSFLVIINTHLSAQTITIIPHVAPSAQSASWTAYRDNALIGIEQNRSVGASGPTVFVPLSDSALGTAGMLSLTPFPSWLGDANPPLPFNNERGSRLFFGVGIAHPVPFRLADVGFLLASSDARNLPPFAGSFAAQDYHASRIGLFYGADGVRGTADDIRRTVGSGTLPVHELYLIGVSRAFTAENVNDLAEIRGIVDAGQPFAITAEYTLGSLRAQRTLNFFAPPPPPPPRFTITATVALTPIGDIAPRTTLRLFGNISNGGPDPYTGLLIAEWQVSTVGILGTSPWARFGVEAGRFTNLIANGTHAVPSREWTAGNVETADPNRIYRLRLLVRASDGEHLSTEFSVRIVVPSIPTVQLRIIHDGPEGVIVTLLGPAGAYDIERAWELRGPWEKIVGVSKTDNTTPTRLLFRREGERAFWRARTK